jgi:hypothetical protein
MGFDGHLLQGKNGSYLDFLGAEGLKVESLKVSVRNAGAVWMGGRLAFFLPIAPVILIPTLGLLTFRLLND